MKTHIIIGTLICLSSCLSVASTSNNVNTDLQLALVKAQPIHNQVQPRAQFDAYTDAPKQQAIDAGYDESLKDIE